MKRGILRREREITDISEIKHILDTAKIVHIGMVDGDEPYVVPMNYGYTLEDGKLTLYMHGAPVGRKTDILKVNPKVFFELECDVQQFGGRVACQYGTSYASVMGNGIAEIVEDVEAKKEGLSLFMKSHTGRDFVFTDKVVSAVSIIKIDVLDYTAKKRPLPMEHSAE